MYEILIGLQVDDEETYDKYREEMLPVIKQHGGYFGYDFRVSEVLITQADHPINRVFTLCFPSKKSADKAFSDSDYLRAKASFFDKAVRNMTEIAEYVR